LGDIKGQIFTFFILTVAAAEAAIGLAILVVYYRNKASVEVEDINTLKRIMALELFIKLDSFTCR
jgi:NADH-quinone oxidoreductase subunit K